MKVQGRPSRKQDQDPTSPVTSRRKAALLLFLTQASVAVLGLPVTVILARTMGPSDYGTFQLLNRLALVTVTALCLGYPHAIAWRAARSRRRGEDRSLVRLLGAISVGGGLAAFAVAALLFLFDGYPGDSLSWWLISLFPLANLLSANIVNFFRGKLNASGIAWVKIVQVVTWGAGIGFGVAVGQMTVSWAVASSVASQFLSVAAGLVMLASRGQLVGAAIPIDKGEVFRFALATYPGLALRDVNVYAAQLLIGFMLSTYDLGLYAAGASLAAVLGLLSGPISNTTQPVIQHVPDDQRPHAVAMSFAAALMVVGLPAAAITVCAPILVPVLYGADFAPATTVVQILCWAAVSDSLGAVAYGALVGVGRPGRSSVSAAIGAASTIALVFLLLPVWGAPGAAIATLAANVLTLTVAFDALRRSLAFPAHRLLWMSICSIPDVAIMAVQMITRRGR